MSEAASEAAPEAAKDRANGSMDPEAGPEPEPEPAPPATTGHVCNVAFCPIGLALTAAEQVQPEVVSHLLLAGREFFLAAKAVMDARAEDLDGEGAPSGPGRMEHIDIG